MTFVGRLAELRARRGLTLLHRYVGLVIAGFIAIAALSGSLLAFYDDLARLASPELHDISPPSPGAAMLDPLALRERALAMGARDFDYVGLRPAAGDAFVFRVEGSLQPEVALDPYTGAVIRRVAGPPFAERIMPFIYELHYALALGEWGIWIMGIIALLWTLDCFIGAILTFPVRLVAHSGPAVSGWLGRWRTAWKIRWGGSGYKLNFDLHRAGGLWIWAALFVFAWTGVGFNLDQVYSPVMRALFTYRDEAALPALAQPQPVPGLSWEEARRTARGLMRIELARRGLNPIEENVLSYDPATATFSYMIRSTADRRDRPNGLTFVTFDANNGAFKNFSSPQQEASGTTVERWLYDLHMGKVWGRPYDIALCLLGVGIAALSVTGVVIWWKKRNARRARRRKLRAETLPSGFRTRATALQPAE